MFIVNSLAHLLDNINLKYRENCTYDSIFFESRVSKNILRQIRNNYCGVNIKV